MDMQEKSKTKKRPKIGENLQQERWDKPERNNGGCNTTNTPRPQFCFVYASPALFIGIGTSGALPFPLQINKISPKTSKGVAKWGHIGLQLVQITNNYVS